MYSILIIGLYVVLIAHQFAQALIAQPSFLTKPVISSAQSSAEYFFANVTDFDYTKYPGVVPLHEDPLKDAFLNRDAHNRSKRSPGFSSVWYPQDLLIQQMLPEPQMKTYLTDQHNKYRMTVPATDMRYMFWAEDLARSAQRHANRCDFRHSNDRVSTGENIWAAPYSDYTDAVRLWWDEINDPTCVCPNAYAHCCGHYTQVVWAASYRVGCGAAYCRDIWGVTGRGHRYVMVCHYNPSGNKVMITPKGQYSLPAFTYRMNAGCSECPPGLENCYNGKLCW